jgi:hypothetical protein
MILLRLGVIADKDIVHYSIIPLLLSLGFLVYASSVYCWYGR